jgi:hypothetical protein
MARTDIGALLLRTALLSEGIEKVSTVPNNPVAEVRPHRRLRIGFEVQGLGGRNHALKKTTSRIKKGIDASDAPKMGIRLLEGYSDIPGLVTAPYHFTLGRATIFRTDNPNPAAQREIRSDNGHAAGVTDINCDTIGAARRFAVLPFHHEAEASNSPLVGTELCPALLELIGCWKHCAEGFWGHWGPHREEVHLGGHRRT